MKLIKYAFLITFVSANTASRLHGMERLSKIFRPKSEPENVELMHNIQLIRDHKKDFEERLAFARVRVLLKKTLFRSPHAPVKFFGTDTIKEEPFKFLQFAYYLQLHGSEAFKISHLYNNTLLSEACKNARFQDFSAIGAAVIAPNVTRNEKQIFIKKLTALGFEPTEADRDLAFLEQFEFSDSSGTDIAQTKPLFE
jgi:hypothetical protein